MGEKQLHPSKSGMQKTLIAEDIEHNKKTSEHKKHPNEGGATLGFFGRSVSIYHNETLGIVLHLFS